MEQNNLILVSDYDGTIKKENLEQMKKDLICIKHFAETGSKVMISTGRNFKSIYDETKQYDIYFDFLSCLNGNVLFDNNLNVLLKTKLDNQVFDVLKPFYKQIISFELLDEYGEITKQDNIMCKIVLNNNLSDERKRLIHLLYHSNMFDYYTDGNNKNIINIFNRSSKVIPIEFIKNNFYDESEIFTIGDGVNDIDMVEKYNGFFIKGTMPAYVPYSLGEYDSISDLINDIKLMKVKRKKNDKQKL